MDRTSHGIVQVLHNSDHLETEDQKNTLLQGFPDLKNF